VLPDFGEEYDGGGAQWCEDYTNICTHEQSLWGYKTTRGVRASRRGTSWPMRWRTLGKNTIGEVRSVCEDYTNIPTYAQSHTRL
jgi:hypothetical protein